MAEAMKPAITLDDPVALRAYAHPLRMALVGLLRREGPMTATRAAAHLGDNVPNCSFHLRQLAKYGLVERAEGADAREKPWRATALFTSWGRDSEDPQVREAVDHLDSMVLGRYFERAQQWLARANSLPVRWRNLTGLGDNLLHVTADELEQLQQEMEELLARYQSRIADPSLRPKDSRAINLIRIALTFEGDDEEGDEEDEGEDEDREPQ
ncbi:MAG TPA: helix-turn-helix domain-containing protein [Candidatus Limnocylindrales bacterium]